MKNTKSPELSTVLLPRLGKPSRSRCQRKTPPSGNPGNSQEKEQLMQELAQQKYALDQHSIVAITDIEGRITYANDQFCAISKYSRDELMGQNHRIIKSGYHPPEFFQEMYQTISRGDVWRGEVLNRAKDGWLYWVHTTIVPFKDAQGKTQSYVAIRTDISERKKAEQSLKENEERFRLLATDSPVGIFLAGANGCFLYTNPRWQQLSGLSAERSQGNGWQASLYSKDAASVIAEWKACMQSGREFAREYRFRTPDGQINWVHTRTAAVRSNGRIMSFVGTTEDITVRKRAEEQVRSMHASLLKSHQDLLRKNEEIQGFYHTLSHELKTPLTSAREFVSLVNDGLAGPLTDSQREYLGIALESCNQLRACINDLLDATRLETGKLSLNLKPVSVADLARRVTTTFAPLAAEKKIQLSCEASADSPSIPCDDYRMTQVIGNLITNALKFTPEGGSIRIEVAEPSDQAGFLQVSVSDTGRGIEPDRLDRVFDRLYQVRSGDAAAGLGVGLGLNICRDLVQLHGGRIWAESAQGRGSTFRFLLPRKMSLKRHRVLVVDDDSDMREILREILEHAQYEVFTAGSGHEALQAIERQAPDVVLLDLAMPEMDGAETLREIRKKWGPLPVIIHTGYPDSDLMLQAMETSPFTVLAKPCLPRQLIETVREVREPKETTFWARQNDPATTPPPAAPTVKNLDNTANPGGPAADCQVDAA